MKVLKRGLVMTAPEDERSMNGESPVGFTLEAVSDADGPTRGFYLLYSNQKTGTGFDDWFERKDLLMDYLETLRLNGWVINWENLDVGEEE